MAKKKSTKKSSSKKKSAGKKSSKKKSTGKKAAAGNVDPLAEAKVELRQSVTNAVKAFAHIANAAEREAIDGLLAVAPEHTETHQKLAERKKKLEKGDTESVASDILAQIRGALKNHQIDFGGSGSSSSKTRKARKK